MTRRRLIGVISVLLGLAVVLLAAELTGDSGSGKPDGAACKAAMRKQFDYGMEHPDGPTGLRPPECHGVSDEDLQRYAGEIMSDSMDNS